MQLLDTNKDVKLFFLETRNAILTVKLQEWAGRVAKCVVTYASTYECVLISQREVLQSLCSVPNSAFSLSFFLGSIQQMAGL